VNIHCVTCAERRVICLINELAFSKLKQIHDACRLVFFRNGVQIYGFLLKTQEIFLSLKI
jgi:hypothetical protein